MRVVGEKKEKNLELQFIENGRVHDFNSSFNVGRVLESGGQSVHCLSTQPT